VGACVLLGVAAAAAASGGGKIGLAYGIGGDKGVPKIVIVVAGHRRTIGAGGVPAVAPNGRAVAFGTEGGKVAVDVYSSRGKLIGKYFDGKRVEAGPIEWSPDSRYIAVGLTDVNSTTTVGESGLAIIDTSTGRATTIAHGQLEGVSWAPTVDVLVFGLAKSVNQQGPSNLYVSGPDGSSLAQLTTDNHSVDPVWGALGVAYVKFRNRGRNNAPAYQLWLLNPKGQSRQITHTKPGPLVEGLVPIAVSANGQRMVAGYAGEDTDNAYTVNLVTRAVREVHSGEQIVTAWGISRNGKRVLVDVGGFENNNSAGKVESVPFGGGRPTVLAKHGDYPSWNQ
jgi:Tol biopolymer transport system component